MNSKDISRRTKGNVETPLKGMPIYSYGIFSTASLSSSFGLQNKISSPKAGLNYIRLINNYLTLTRTIGSNFAPSKMMDISS
jgi:hypothetical protein